jgi:hypothetical protein
MYRHDRFQGAAQLQPAYKHPRGRREQARSRQPVADFAAVAVLMRHVCAQKHIVEFLQQQEGEPAAAAAEATS